MTVHKLRVRYDNIQNQSLDMALETDSEIQYVELINLKAEVDNLIFEIFACSDQHGITEDELKKLLDYQVKLGMMKAKLDGKIQ